MEPRGSDTSKEIRLDPWSEYIGVVKDCEVEEQKVVIVFENGKKLIVKSCENVIELPRKIIGNRVSVLRTDNPDMEFILHLETGENIYCNGGDINVC